MVSLDNQYQEKIKKIELIKRILPTLLFIIGVSFVILSIFFMVMFVFLLAINVVLQSAKIYSTSTTIEKNIEINFNNNNDVTNKIDEFVMDKNMAMASTSQPDTHRISTIPTAIMKNLRSKSNRNLKSEIDDMGNKNLLINSINENSLVKLILSPESLLKNFAKTQIKIDTSEIPLVETTTIPMTSTTTEKEEIKSKKLDAKLILATTTDVTTNEIEMNKSKSQEFIDNDTNLEIDSNEDDASIISSLSETVEILGEMIDSFISEELLSKDLVNESLAIQEKLPIEKHDANHHSEKNYEKKVTDIPSENIISNENPTEIPSIETKANDEVNNLETDPVSEEKDIDTTKKDDTFSIETIANEEVDNSEIDPLSKEKNTLLTDTNNKDDKSYDMADVEENKEETNQEAYDHHLEDESKKIEIYALPDTIPENDQTNMNVPDVIELTEEIIIDQPNLSTEMLSITEIINKNPEVKTATAESIITEPPSSESPTESPLSHILHDNGPSPVLENDDLMSAIDSPEISIWPNVGPTKMVFPKKFFKKVPSLFRPNSALSSRRSAIDDSLAHHDLHSLLKQIRKFRPQLKPRQRKRAIGDEGSLDNIIRPLDKPTVTSAPIQMQTPLQSYEHYFQNTGQTSLEQAEQFEKGLQRLVQFVQIAAHIDSYLTSRFKSGIKTIAKIMESEEVSSSSSRRMRRYSF